MNVIFVIFCRREKKLDFFFKNSFQVLSLSCLLLKRFHYPINFQATAKQFINSINPSFVPNILNKMVTHPIRIIHPKYRPNGPNHQQTTSQNFLSSFGSITRSNKSVEAFAELSSQVWPNSILGKLNSYT